MTIPHEFKFLDSLLSPGFNYIVAYQHFLVCTKAGASTQHQPGCPNIQNRETESVICPLSSAHYISRAKPRRIWRPKDFSASHCAKRRSFPYLQLSPRDSHLANPARGRFLWSLMRSSILKPGGLNECVAWTWRWRGTMETMGRAD